MLWLKILEKANIMFLWQGFCQEAHRRSRVCGCPGNSGLHCCDPIRLGFDSVQATQHSNSDCDLIPYCVFESDSVVIRCGSIRIQF